MSNVRGPFIGYVTAADYATFLTIVTDPSNFPADHQAFQAHFEQILQHYRNQGLVPVQVYVNPADLLAWCRAAGREVNATARMEFAVEVGTSLHHH